MDCNTFIYIVFLFLIKDFIFIFFCKKNWEKHCIFKKKAGVVRDNDPAFVEFVSVKILCLIFRQKNLFVQIFKGS